MNKKELKNYLDEIAEIRYYDPQRVIKICRQMIAKGKKEKDEPVRIYGEYYQIETYIRLGTINASMLKRTMRVLQAAKRNSMHEIEGRCYNLIGVFLVNQGDLVNAMEYYQMGMDLALKHRYSAIVRILTNNIGDMYLHMKDYPKALSYLKKAYQQSEKLIQKQKETGQTLIYSVNLNVSLLNISEVYYQLGDYEQSLHYIRMLKPGESGIENTFYSASESAMYALNYGHMGQMEKAWDYIWKLVEAAEAGYGKLESTKDYLNVCQMMIENDELEVARRLLRAVYGFVKELELVNIWCNYYEVMIQYQKKCGTPEERLQTYEEYFTYKKQKDLQEERQQIQAIQNRQALDSAEKYQARMEKRTQQLKRMSEHDALTGLYNRYALNRESEIWYREAMEHQTTMGVIVLDVDYFKQYNDAYGHLGGDDCLKCVSDVLREAVSAEDMIIRYGGDEFFILSRGKTDEEMLKLAKNINTCMRKKHWVHKESLVSDYITLSQGVANGIPEEFRTVSDLIHLADNALYRAKEAKRGSIGVCRNDGDYSIYDSYGVPEKVGEQ